MERNRDISLNIMHTRRTLEEARRDGLLIAEEVSFEKSKNNFKYEAWPKKGIVLSVNGVMHKRVQRIYHVRPCGMLYFEGKNCFGRKFDNIVFARHIELIEITK